MPTGWLPPAFATVVVAVAVIAPVSVVVADPGAKVTGVPALGAAKFCVTADVPGSKPLVRKFPAGGMTRAVGAPSAVIAVVAASVEPGVTVVVAP